MDDKNATLYEWCLVNNIRPNDAYVESSTDAFMLNPITYDEFKRYFDKGNYKENSTPRKPDKYLELRMYGLVPYNLSPIQQGIQFNHANDQYSIDAKPYNKIYDRFRKEWKTNILLNGGTSNEGHMVRQGFRETMYVGSMQQHLADLKANNIKVSTFYEPDLNSMLTAIVFLVDERVFNKELYPDFSPPLDPLLDPQNHLSDEAKNEALIKWSAENEKQYAEWVNKIGGPKNEFLRDFLRGKRLA